MFSKLFRPRNRKVVTLPQEALELLEIRDDMDLDIVVDAQNRQIVLRPVEKQIDPAIAEKIMNSIRQQSVRTSPITPKNRLI